MKAKVKNNRLNASTSNNGSSSNQPNVGEKHSTFDILTKISMNSSIHDKYVLNFEEIENIEAPRTCKVLKFPSNISIEDILSKISKLDSQQCGHLFIFTIEVEELSKLKINDLQKCLQKFSETRLIILQIKINKENVTKIYFKWENSNFQEVEQSSRNDQAFDDFPTFLQLFLTSKVTNFEGLMLEKLPTIKDSQHIIRFLRTLKLSKEFYKQLVLTYSADGSKIDLLAAIDAPFELDGRMLNCEAENWIKHTITVKKGSNSRQNNRKSDQSVLLAAVVCQNVEVLDYLISYCGPLIQQLPYKHQVQVSTTAYDAMQYDVLCDLVKLCDFPFPDNFKPDATENERFNKIITERKEFFEAVDSEELNLPELSKFISKNTNLNIVYNFYNNSTLYHALTSGHYEAYVHLKSLGFEAVEFDDISDVLEGDELKKANKIINKQRRTNVENSSSDSRNPIDLLATRSKIHNRKTRSEDETKYREMIKKWYKEIFESRWGCHLLRVASMCQKLRIIFDFESDSVKNVSLQSKYTKGSMYPQSKWIFVGAKLPGINREQQIKGTIAHELCHYVMNLVYENNVKPYFKHDKSRRLDFVNIVIFFDKWSKSKENPKDDECDGIISRVYTSYNKKVWIAELIVRIPQILAHFDKNTAKIGVSEVLYKRLFQYYETFVVEDMSKFNLEEREKIRMINKNFNTLPIISCLNYEFQTPIDINAMYSNTTVVQTNIPKFLYSELYKSVQDEYGNLVDCYNIFLNYDKLKDDEILKNYSQIIKETKERNIFVDCTGQNGIELTKIGFSESNKFIFICSKNEQFEKVRNSLEQINTNPTLSPKDYNWLSLSQKSQKALLQTEINFQNTKQKFFDILWNKIAKPSDEDNARICKGFSEIADDELLNLMADKKEISIQTNLAHETIDENFQIIFRDRNFIKKVNFKSSDEISQIDLIENTQKDPFVLISDIAGTGKSWAMKMITKMLREQPLTKWITYIDLKQFVKDFEAQKKNELNFLNFMIEKVFDFKRSFESKMFKELYKNGHVCILLDGFDEISPNYAEIVKKLIELFEQNGGNQLWIATRDFFEVDLQEHLKLDVLYKLVDFRDEDGIDIIVRNCVLADLKSNKIEITKDFNNQVKKHPKYQIYLEAARKLHKKISKWNFKSIGLPQLYKMIGDVLIEFQDSTDELTEFTLYDKFIDHLYKRWYSEKGKLREQKNIDNQNEDMNYRELHEFCAMKSLLPENSSFCDLELDKDDWSDEEVVGGGILNKKTEDGDEFLFPHETYREFFAACFIIRILKKKPKKIDLDVLKYLIKFCLNKKYGVIQMFLRQGFKDIKALSSNKMIIVNTDVPKLLQINIYQHIQKENKNARNIFVIQDDPNSNKLCEDFGDNFIQNSNLNYMVKPQKDFGKELNKLKDKNLVTVVIIVPSEERGIEVSEILQQFKFEPKTLEMKYDWNDLTDDSQKALLQSEVNIDNHSIPSLFEFISDENAPKNNQKAGTDFSTIITNELLNIVVNKSQIKVKLSRVLKYEMEQKTSQLLFLQRSFIKKDNTNKKATVKFVWELLYDVNHDKYVLISDVAFTGKSIAMQNITNTLRQRYPRKWITYIDLKRFCDEFKSHDNGVNPEFSAFVLNNFLKFVSSNWENINSILPKYFIKLYKAGMIIFLFDGFDEISPNYAEIVKKLIESFKQNGGNQLWIATRDFFEVDLQKHLKLDISYKLVDLREKDVINIIVRNCVLTDLRSNEIEVTKDFNNQVKKHPKYQIYYQAARKLHKKISEWNVLIEFQDSIDKLTEFALYDKVIDHLFERWYSEKGELRKKRFKDSQKEEINYRELHEFFAMKSLLPENSSFCGLELDKENWSDEEIVGGGILNKKTEDGDEFLFPHETYREFFAACFIIRILKKKPKKIDLDVLKYLIKFCLNEKYGVIQMFLRQGFKEVKALPSNKMIIVSTNVPKLLQIDIYQHIQKENKNARNIFVIQDDPNSNKLCEDFGDDFIQNSNLKAMVKSKKDFGEEIKKLEEKNSVTIIIIVQSEERGIEVSEILQQFKFEPSIMKIEYDFNDLSVLGIL